MPFLPSPDIHLQIHFTSITQNHDILRRHSLDTQVYSSLYLILTIPESVFLSLSLVVTDLGAPVSQAAIIAPELGIPAIVGCEDTTCD